MRPLPALALFALACTGGEPDPQPTEPTSTANPEDTAAPVVDPLIVAPNTPITLDAGEQASFDVTGVDPAQNYRVTLVAAEYITVGPNGTATFQDSGAGTANAGPSDSYAGLFHIHYGSLPALAKTFPAGTDDPANPSGILPLNGSIGFGVEGVDAGTVYPVIYTNAGASTFLEIDGTGTPIEPYVVGPAITVNDAGPTVDPSTPTPLAVGGTQDVTITGLDDSYAYRITLVVSENVTTTGDGTGTFVDSGAGTANAGASQERAVITAYNGTNPVDPPAKTIPAADDDPAAPSGITPSGGSITVSVQGVASGTVYPVIYRNGGVSTFLEIDGTGTPTETYIIGGALQVP